MFPALLFASLPRAAVSLLWEEQALLQGSRTTLCGQSWSC